MSNARSRSRQLAMQALYQWQMTGANLSEIEGQFLAEHGQKRMDKEYFHTLFHGVPASLDEVDEALSPCMDRGLEEVDEVERAILRLSAYELLKHIEVPYRVVINEGVELAKRFGAEQGHRYINGVLDKLAVSARSAEVKQHKSTG